MEYSRNPLSKRRANAEPSPWQNNAPPTISAVTSAKAQSAEIHALVSQRKATAGQVADGSKRKLLGGDNSSCSTNDLSPANWRDNGRFEWMVGWVTDGTSGWVVQRVVNTYSGTDGNGDAINNASVGAAPSYCEGWAVDESGNVTGSGGDGGNDDTWARPDMGEGSRGNWSMAGTVYWTATDPALSGFTLGGVDNAGSLLAGTSAPADLSGPLLNRFADSEWDSTAD